MEGKKLWGFDVSLAHTQEEQQAATHPVLLYLLVKFIKFTLMNTSSYQLEPLHLTVLK